MIFRSNNNNNNNNNSSKTDLSSQLVIYCLSVYFFFHLASRADLFAKPRAALVKVLPNFATYPLTCCFCFTWWVGLGVSVVLSFYLWTIFLSPMLLMAGPVFNLVLDKIVTRLSGYTISYWTGATGTTTDTTAVRRAGSVGDTYRDWETDRKSTRLNSSHRL